MVDSVGLWPGASRRSVLRSMLRRCSRTEVENLFQQSWPSGTPILLSSGRAALALALRTCGLSRPDVVRLFPYASHCVIESVGRVATPCAPAYHDWDASIHYHQWGYERRAVDVDIEDSVDSLYAPGAPLFASNGRFEVWSISKILGSSGGGVLWCQDPDDAARGKQILHSIDGQEGVRWALRAAGLFTRSKAIEGLWAAKESLGGRPTQFLASEVAHEFPKWERLVSDRRARLEEVLDRGISIVEIPSEFVRLPSILPLSLSALRVETLRTLGYEAAPKHFLRSDGQMTQVLPLPIHHGVPDGLFARTVEALART